MPHTITEVPVFMGRQSGAERRMLAALGGEPWQLDRLTAESIAEAEALWMRIRKAAGFTSRGRWFTDETTSSKLAKNGIATRGVTLHSATGAKDVWASLDLETKWSIAEAFDEELHALAQVVGLTMCAMATKECINACTTAESANAQASDTKKSRLLRTLMHLVRPDLAFALTGAELRKVQAKHGEDCRWRVNVSDDICWEELAPGLFDIGVPGYSYTKHSPARRPGSDRFRVVYSASEKTSDEQIHHMIRQGHNVAVVFHVKKKHLPTSWQGIEVVDGDATDDLYSHKPATIVGLAVKGRTNAIKEDAAEGGFARAA